MPIFQKADKMILFVHIPKAAGSSIEQLFTESGWSMNLFKPCSSPYEPAEQHLTYEKLGELLEDIDDITSFTVVRNPFRRLVSEWRWQLSTMRTTDVDFDHFVRRVQVSLLHSRTYWDNHWRPQTEFLSDAINRVMKIENIDEDFSNFAREHDLDLAGPIPRRNRSRRRFLRSSPKLACSTETMDRILEIYETDFDVLGYPKEMPALA